MNKRVLVTGSTKGIGQGILKKFHEGNWDVCVTGRNNQQVTKLENKLNNQIFLEKAPKKIILQFKNQVLDIKSSIEKIDQIINTIN